MKRALAFLPVIIVAIIGAFAYWGLQGGRNPAEIPSALISQPVPEFALEGIEGVASPGLATSDLKTGALTLVNVFASWCVPCRAEHAVLTRMTAQQNLRLVGINYKDRADAARDWLEELGNPYVAIGHDFTGRAGIEWGVTGVPETFIIDGDGTIVHRFVGPVVGDGERRFQEALGAAKAAAEPGS